jgi:PLP dependent protein
MLQRLIEDILPVRVCVVTKKRSVADIRGIVYLGARVLGENRIQECLEKYGRELLDYLRERGVELHFIGHLQTNKVKDAVRLFDCVQSVDSVRLAEKLSEECTAKDKEISIFLEVNLTGEDEKHGLTEDELLEHVDEIKGLPGLRVEGLMCMGKMNESGMTREIFRKCCELADRVGLAELSMGMSDDYKIAIKEGATMVRIGRLIFE